MRSVLVTVALAATAAAEDAACEPASAGVCQHRGVDSKASRWRRGGGGAAMPRIVRGVIFDRRADVENWRLGRERTRPPFRSRSASSPSTACQGWKNTGTSRPRVKPATGEEIGYPNPGVNVDDDCAAPAQKWIFRGDASLRRRGREPPVAQAARHGPAPRAPTGTRTPREVCATGGTAARLIAPVRTARKRSLRIRHRGLFDTLP